MKPLSRKKSLLNIAVTMAISTTLLSASVLTTQAYAAEAGLNNAILANQNEHNEAERENYLYPGMGIGAATGTAIAGPVGLVIGGLIGAFVGASQTTENEVDINSETSIPAVALDNSENSITTGAVQSVADNSTTNHSVQVARLGAITAVADESIESEQDKLLDILTDDLSFDVYFRSGSADIESFYPSRLAAIAGLLNNMNALEIHLDGYTDRRGDSTRNMALANQRIEKVRQQLITAGIDGHRIISNAYGEMKMVSAPGDLEAYTFDRKVVIRFQRATPDSIHAMKQALSVSDEKTTGRSISQLEGETDAVAQF